MMSASASPERHILLADPDRSQSSLLATMLQKDRYIIDESSTLEEGLRLVTEYPYDLVITDLFVISSPPGLDAAQQIRDNCQPTPVGILTAWPLDPLEVTNNGFAFLLSKPLKRRAVLGQVTAALNPPVSPEQAQHAHLVRRYLHALSIGDWDVVRALCTPYVGYYPLTRSLFTSARAIIGIDAYLTHAQQAYSRLPDFRIERVVIFSQAIDLVARYRASWQAPDGGRQGISGFVICRFHGERISQIGATIHQQGEQKTPEPPELSGPANDS